MEARVTTIWLPPSRLEEAIQFVRDEVVPALAAQPGQRGIWLFADRSAGTLLSIGLWETTAALEATTFLYQELRAKVGSLYGGPPIAEPYEARRANLSRHLTQYRECEGTGRQRATRSTSVSRRDRCGARRS